MNTAQQKQDDEDFATAFNDSSADGAAPVRTDEEEFGAPSAPEQAMDEAEPATAEAAPAAEPAAEAPAAEEPATPQVEEPTSSVDVSPTPGEAVEGEALTAEDEQRKRSWEGRLKAREAELKAREDALAGREVDLTPPPTEEPGQEAVNFADGGEAQAAPDYAAIVAEDFGPDLLKAFEAIADQRAQARAEDAARRVVGEMSGKSDERISALEAELNEAIDSLNNMHMGDLEDAHGDFREVIASPEFAQWKATLPEAARARVDRASAGGSAQQCIKVLNDFKAALPSNEPAPADGVTDDELEAAEGVRSSGLKLPSLVGPGTEGFEDTWKNLPD
jgi:hypothetical protein